MKLLYIKCIKGVALYSFVFKFYEGVAVAVVVVVVVAAAPQTALRVVENHFAIAINGALKILLELGSAPMEDVRSTIFLSWSAVELQLFAKSSKSGCGC